MKLRNKKTGEIIDLDEWSFGTYNGMFYIARGDAEGDNIEYFKSFADFNSKYEDYEEPFSTSFYTIVDGEIYKERIAGCPDDAWAYLSDDDREHIKQLKEVGLYFETKEEAEKAIEKLKAWKRLKDKGFKYKGFKFECWYGGSRTIDFEISDCKELLLPEEICDDLKLLFGGEDE